MKIKNRKEYLKCVIKLNCGTSFHVFVGSRFSCASISFIFSAVDFHFIVINNLYTHFFLIMYSGENIISPLINNTRHVVYSFEHFTHCCLLRHSRLLIYYGQVKKLTKVKVLSGFEPELQGGFNQIKTLGDNQLHYRTCLLEGSILAFIYQHNLSRFK